MKKVLSVLVAVCMSVSALFSVSAHSVFSDVNETDAAYGSILKLAEKKIVEGDGDGNFRPADGLTRAEFCKIINKIFGYTQEDDIAFTDVKPKDWFYKEVRIAKKAGYIAGFEDNTFRGNEMLTREQTCTIISKVAKLYKLPYTYAISDSVSDWAKEYVDKVISNRLMSVDKDNKFRATENITRAEMAQVSANFVYDEDNGSADNGTDVKDNEDTQPKPSTGGNSGSSGGNKKNYEKINVQMISSLNSVKDSMSKLTFTEKEQEVVDIVVACVDKALVKAKSVELTKEYIKTEYASDIDKANALIDAMSEDEQSGFRGKIVRKVDDEAYEFLMDFFFGDEN